MLTQILLTLLFYFSFKYRINICSCILAGLLFKFCTIIEVYKMLIVLKKNLILIILKFIFDRSFTKIMLLYSLTHL